MPYTIDIDTGGTSTDSFVSHDKQTVWAKVDTTPHDLTVGFINCLKESAKKLNLNNMEALLKDTEVIRLSTTIGVNSLIEKSGPKLGLIITKGFEKKLYGENKSRNGALDFLIPSDMIRGVRGEVDASGNIIQPLDEEEVKSTVKELLIKGARVLVVSLLNSSLNPTLEKQLRTIIEVDYPKHFLGSIPVVLSTEITLERDDAYRTNAALLDAYMHRVMVGYLYRAEDDVREARYRRPLLIVHNWGGVARVAKTKAINTYNSGPAAGVFGAAAFSTNYQEPNVISIDMGGTSADIGFVVNGKCGISFESDIVGVPIKLPLVEVQSLGAGGGSIATVSQNSQELRVGPESAGALPGPACYGLGGTEPTVTDAFLVLGYINPDYFLGGQRKLDINKAYNAIKEKVAEPLKSGVEETSLKIIKAVESTVETAINQLLTREGLTGKDVSLLSFGGSGGLFCTNISNALSIPRTYVPRFAGNFSAFGSSTMDVIHEYEHLAVVTLRTASGEYLSDFDSLNKSTEKLMQAAIRDMRGEGFSSDNIDFSLELELRSTSPYFTARIDSPGLRFENKKDIEDVVGKLEAASPEKASLNGEIVLDTLKVRAMGFVPHLELTTYSATSPNPEAAFKGTRKVFWDRAPIDTPLYEQEKLLCGNVVSGPAIVEGEYTTIIIPEGKKFSVDKFLFGVIEDK